MDTRIRNNSRNNITRVRVLYPRPRVMLTNRYKMSKSETLDGGGGIQNKTSRDTLLL